MRIIHVKIIAYSIIAISAGTWQYFIQYVGLLHSYLLLSFFKQMLFGFVVACGISSVLTILVKVTAKVFFPSLVYSKTNPVTLKE